MSVLARIKEIVAGMADGHHHALMAVAEEVDKIKSGVVELPQDAFAKLESEFKAKIEAEIAPRLAVIEARLGELSKQWPAPNTPAPPPDGQAPLENAGTAVQAQPGHGEKSA